MSESWEHFVLKSFLGEVLGKVECQVLGGRADACSPTITAEVECGPKKNGTRTCRIEFREQPDQKNRFWRQQPFLTFDLDSGRIKKLETVMKRLSGRVTFSPT